MLSKTFRRVSNHRVAGLIAVASLGVSFTPTMVHAQVNGTWTGGTGNWFTTSNWISGTVAQTGGIATFIDSTSPQASIGVNINTLAATGSAVVELSKIIINSAGPYEIRSTTAPTGSISFPLGLTLEVNKSAARAPGFVSTYYSNITASMTGGLLTKTGPGMITISGTNSFVGLTVTQGIIRLASGSNGLGSTTGTLSFNGGGLRVVSSDLASARPLIVGSNGFTLETDASATGVTLSGTVTGTGAWNYFGAGNLLLSGNQANFTGSLNNLNGGSVSVATTGSLAAVTSIQNAGILGINNSATNNLPNRINDAAVISSRGGEIRISPGTANIVVTETLGTVNLENGQNIFSLNAGLNQATLTINQLNRVNRSTGIFRGTNLGAAAGPGVAAIVVNAGDVATIGGGGSAGTTSISILPWAYGNSSGYLSGTFNGSLVTRDSATGSMRPLNLLTEYATNLSTATSIDNFRVDGATADTGAGASVNAVVVSANGLITTPGAITGTGNLTIASGTIVSATFGATNSLTNSISAPIKFGNAEGIFITPAALNVAGPISGTKGITKSSDGLLTLGSTASDFSGDIVLNSGQLNFSGDVLNDGVTPSALGVSGTIILQPGNGSVRLAPLTAGTIARPINVTGTGSASATIGTFSQTGLLTISGPVSLSRELSINAPSVSFTGVISGTGRLSDASTNSVGPTMIFNSSNSYSGGTDMARGTYIINSDSALGSGMIWADSSIGSTIVATGSVTRTLPNDLTIVNNSGVLAFNSTDADSKLVITGTVDLGGPTADVYVLGAPVTFSGKLTNGRINKRGTGTLILTSDSNDYAGIGIVTTGTLQFGDGGTSGSPSTNSTSTSATGTVVFNRGGTIAKSMNFTGNGSVFFTGSSPLTLSSTATFSSALGTVAFNGAAVISGTATVNTLALGFGVGSTTTIASTGTLTTPSTGTTVSFAGNALVAGTTSFSGTGTLVNFLAGSTTTFSGASTISGAYQVQAGATLITLGANGSLGTGPNILDGGSFIINRTGTVSYGGFFKGAGTFTFAGSGTSRFSSAMAITGPVFINAGSVVLGSNNAAGDFGTPQFVSLAATGTLSFFRTDTYTPSINLSGAGTIGHTGSGKTIITQDWPLTGPVVINAGTFQLGDGITPGSVGTGAIGASNTSTGTLAFAHPTGLSFANTIAGPVSVANVGPGPVTLTGSIAYTGNTTATDSSLTINSAVITPGRTIAATGTASAVVLNASVNSTSTTLAAQAGLISVAAGNVVSVTPTNRAASIQKVVLVNSIDLAANTATLDLANNDMIVRGQSEASIGAMVSAWYQGGLKTGLGIKSSTAGGVGADAYATLAVVSNDNLLGGVVKNSFDGVSVLAGDVFVKYTYAGDTNLDGIVNVDDLNALVLALADTSLTGWRNGDVDYDGHVTLTDLSLLLASMNNQAGTFNEGPAGTTQSGAVPEPGALGLVLIAAPLLGRRRR